ncbi:MAG: ABC transporter permease [Clostridia bacterium]|nr:ABC transporter permease [Clostridia bacterium]
MNQETNKLQPSSAQPTQYHTHISAKKRLFQLNLGEVWRYRDLIVLFTRRSFVLTYKQTVLGPAWIFLTPIITSLIYTFVFGGIAGISTDGVPTLLFYLTSNAVWNFFSSCVTQNAATFTANANVFGKVYFPRLTIPISNMLASVIQFFVQMILVAILLGYYSITGAVSPNWWGLLLIPVILLQLGVLGLGVGIIISSLTTKYRDLAILVTFGVQLWMYATPIVYPLSQLSDGLMRTILTVNPVTAPVELFRWALLGEGTILPLALILSAVLTVVVALVGVMIFNRVEKTFMDTV